MTEYCVNSNRHNGHNIVHRVSPFLAEDGTQRYCNSLPDLKNRIPLDWQMNDDWAVRSASAFVGVRPQPCGDCCELERLDPFTLLIRELNTLNAYWYELTNPLVGEGLKVDEAHDRMTKRYPEIHLRRMLLSSQLFRALHPALHANRPFPFAMA